MRASSLHPNQADNQPCPKCGALDGFVKRPNGPHIGLYCVACDGWQRWVPRREELKAVPNFGHRLVEPAPVKKIDHPWGDPPAKALPPKYSPRQLAHPATLDERVAALEFDTRVIAEILMGARDGR